MIAALAVVLVAAGCTGDEPQPDPSTPPPDGLGLAITSAKPEYRRGEPISLTVTLTNGLTSQCTVTVAVEGAIAITVLTRDGAPLAPTMISGDYIGGFTEFLRTSQNALAPGASASVPWVSEGRVPALTTSTVDALDTSLIAAWPVSEAGKYELSARYSPPSLAGQTAAACPVFASPTSADYTQIVKELDLAAAPLTLKLEHLVVRSAKDFEAAFQAADGRRAEAALVRLPGPVMDPNRTQFIGLAAKRRLPVIYERAREVGSRRAYVLPYKRS